MPRKDTFHNAVVQALLKDGWTITHDPYTLIYDRESLYIDLGAETPIGAEKPGRKIAVEVKSFLGKSGITELERALGQYVLYRSLLRSVEPERILFIGMPEEAFNAILNVTEGRDLIQQERLHILVFDPVQEQIEQWIP